MGISDEIIRAAVQAGQYSDPRAEQFLVDALIERRNKIGQYWLTAINPVVDPALGADGSLNFRNAAVDYKFAEPPDSYLVKWYRFDNGTGESQELGTRTGQPPFASPADLTGSFVRVDISAVDPAHPDMGATRARPLSEERSGLDPRRIRPDARCSADASGAGRGRTQVATGN